MNPLHLLADHDREREAPPHIEARLVARFRARRRRRTTARVVMGALAAGVVAALLVVPRFETSQALLEIRVAPPLSPAVEPMRPQPARTPQRVILARSVPLRELDTEFFPLMDSAPPFERGQILRVDVPVSTMRSVGLPVLEEHLNDRIQADILVGEEGMPRAIRFVSFETR